MCTVMADDRGARKAAEMMQAAPPRFRHEYKYMLNALQEGILRVKAGGVLMPDAHTNEDGSYLVRSLYFDDVSDTCLRENEAGTDPRSKFRIRYYNGDTSRIMLEKKSKIRGMCAKESCRISERECQMFMDGQVPNLAPGASADRKRLFTEMRIRGMMPKVIVTYERVPFVYVGGNVRITFDRNITSSVQLDHFLKGDYAERPILPAGGSILEVKWDELLPRHIRETLQIENLTWTAFSKYFMCRMFHL